MSHAKTHTNTRGHQGPRPSPVHTDVQELGTRLHMRASSFRVAPFNVSSKIEEPHLNMQTPSQSTMPFIPELQASEPCHIPQTSSQWSHQFSHTFFCVPQDNGLHQIKILHSCFSSSDPSKLQFLSCGLGQNAHMRYVLCCACAQRRLRPLHHQDSCVLCPEPRGKTHIKSIA